RAGDQSADAGDLSAGRGLPFSDVARQPDDLENSRPAVLRDAGAFSGLDPEALAMKKAHWAEIGEYSLVWGMRVLLGMYRLGGRPIVQGFLYPVVAYYWLVNRQGRAASCDYLRRIAALRPQGGRLNSFRHFMTFAEAILDKLAAWAGMISLADVDYRGREAL